MIDLNAAIIPWVGMGGIKLYDSIKELKKILSYENAKACLYDNFLIRYKIENKLYLFFNLINGKLYKITALKDYKGSLFEKIRIGMTSKELLEIDPSFEYDDFEEVYVSSKGVFIETDIETDQIMWISVFIRELETDKFIHADW